MSMTRIVELEQVLNELYQILGALNAPEKVLDQVYAAMAGEPLPLSLIHI